MRLAKPNVWDFFPVTYTLPMEHKYFQLDTQDAGDQRTYISKPYIKKKKIKGEKPDKEDDIFLSRITRDFKSTHMTIVQKYISKCHLYENFKWDFKLYVCVVGVNPLRIYIFKDGLCRLAAKQYPYKVLDGNMGRLDMHLCRGALEDLAEGEKPKRFTFR